MSTQLWTTQIQAVIRLELKRFILARRWLGVYIIVAAPVGLMLMFSRMAPARFDSVEQLSQGYANLFQLFILRFGIFISCAVVLSQAFRGDVLEKTLHFYLLAPVRREMVAVGKYLAGVIFITALFSVSIIASHLLIYAAGPHFSAFYLEGPGLLHLFFYLTAAVLATIAYGSLFLLAGMFFKNPGIPALFLLGWESLNFALPSLLQHISVIYYLQALLPVTIDRGPFAVVVEHLSPVFGIPILLAGTALMIAFSSWFVRYTQVTYSAD